MRCAAFARYHVIDSRDGRIVLVRERPAYKSIRVEVPSCGYGCGTQMNERPVPLAAIVLGAQLPSAIEIRELEHEQWSVEEHCKNPTPVP
jgi:hypothetical protein